MGVFQRLTDLVRPHPIEGHPWDFPELMLFDWIKSWGRGLTVYVVGAYLGHEVSRLLATRAVEKIVLFEPLPETAARLRERVARYSQAEVIEAAASDTDGRATFRENNLPGNGSLLNPSAMVRVDYGTSPSYEVEVATVRLDTFAREPGRHAPDILWIDVQGAEAMVLRGAEECLAAAKLVFIEISTWTPTYEGGCVTSDLADELVRHGYRMIQLGTDPRNGTGNALFAKAEAYKRHIAESVEGPR